MATDQLMERVTRIESAHSSQTQKELRLWGLKFSMGARLDQPAEYAVVTGCRATAVFLHLSSFVKLLKHYDVDYTFLSEESCCGNSFMSMLDPNEHADEVPAFEDYARKFEGRNVARAKELGAKKIMTVCAGCNTRYNQFQAGGDLEVVHYTQFLTQYVKGLSLDATVDFYEGCHRTHRTKDFKIDTQASRALLGGIEGLVVNDIPNYCCRKVPDKIFETAKTRTIVTPTNCCWATLSMRKPSDSVQVRYLSEILCQAIGI